MCKKQRRTKRYIKLVLMHILRGMLFIIVVASCCRRSYPQLLLLQTFLTGCRNERFLFLHLLDAVASSTAIYDAHSAFVEQTNNNVPKYNAGCGWAALACLPTHYAHSAHIQTADTRSRTIHGLKVHTVLCALSFPLMVLCAIKRAHGSPAITFYFFLLTRRH